MAKNPDLRRYVLRGVVIAVALLLLLFVLLALYVHSLPEGAFGGGLPVSTACGSVGV